MSRRLAVVVVGLVVVVAAGAWLSNDSGADDPVLIFAPSSLAPVQDELDAAFADTGLAPVEWLFAGSQSLVAQLADGAPTTVVLTADRQAHLAARAVADFTGSGSFAFNRLVLAVAPGNPGAVTDLSALEDPERIVGSCAIEVPCGRYAAEALDALGVDPVLDTEETSARALTTKIATGEIDAGLIYRTDAIDAGLTIVDVPALANFRTEYWGLATGDGLAYLDYLVTDEAFDVFVEAGYLP